MPAYGLASCSPGRVMTKRVREKLFDENAAERGAGKQQGGRVTWSRGPNDDSLP